MPAPDFSTRKLRHSACADSALRVELARVGRMTIEQRVKAALSLRERFAWLQTTGVQPAAKDK